MQGPLATNQQEAGTGVGDPLTAGSASKAASSWDSGKLVQSSTRPPISCTTLGQVFNLLGSSSEGNNNAFSLGQWGELNEIIYVQHLAHPVPGTEQALIT